ncbi:MAG: hypothetical protein O3A66_02735 [Proteobacteria bacterium]|nr:hypothetical protein [Pseudomonadota bacterium]
MLDLKSFYSSVNDIDWTDTLTGNILETPFLESDSIPELNHILKHYYTQNFKHTLALALPLTKQFPDDSCLYNLIACCFFGMKEYNKAGEFFNIACQIVYSYHAVYHFIGYVLHYNRATLHHIMQNNTAMEKDLSKAQFLYHRNNPERDIPIIINEENLHFKNPSKDMFPKQVTISHLSVFKGSELEKEFWNSLKFFEKRQWNRAMTACNNLISKMEKTHLEYHYFAARMFYNRGMNNIVTGNTGNAIGDFSKAIAFDIKNPSNTLYKKALKQAQGNI